MQGQSKPSVAFKQEGDSEPCGCRLEVAGSHFPADGEEDGASVQRDAEPRGQGEAWRMST